MSGEELNSAALWKLVKPLARQLEDDEEGVLIIDDTIEESPTPMTASLSVGITSTSKGRSVKGINLISTLYQVGEASIPVAFELVKKSKWVWGEDKERWQRKSPQIKNKFYRRMLKACQNNRLRFRYVLSDVWCSASGNMAYIKEELEREFLMPLKSNRKVALCAEDKQRGAYERVACLQLEHGTTRKVYLQQVAFPLLLVKQVFKNKDGGEGVLYLVSSDVTLDYERLTTIYKRRWQVEYHKSLKSNASLSRSPTKTMRTQGNHVFVSIWSFVKLEQMKLATSMNHFTLHSHLRVKAVEAAFWELQDLRLTQVHA